MPHPLPPLQKERATVTANIVVAAMVRLEREQGEAAIMEALRLIISALPSDNRRKAIVSPLMSGKPPAP